MTTTTTVGAARAGAPMTKPGASWRRRPQRALALVLAAALSFSLAPAMPAAAAPTTDSPVAAAWGGNTANTLGGTDYHLDATAGDDAADGRTPATAWKTLARANAVTFQPGDRVLLKAGETWSGQQLWPKGSGADGRPIEIDAYGTATRRPYIAVDGNVPSPFRADGSKNPDTVGLTGAVVLRNQQYWEISSLEVSNDDDFATDITTQKVVRDGISVSINADLLPAGSDTIMNHVRVSDIYAHDIDGPSTWQRIHYGGINFQVFGSQQYTAYGTGGYYFQDVRIENNTFDMVELHAVQFAFNWFGDAQGQTDEAGKYHEGWEQLWVRTRDLYSRDVYIGHNYAKDTGQGAIQLANTKDMVVEYNEIDGFLKRYNQVSAGLYLWAGADSVMRFNEVYGGPANEYDATPWDLEFTNFNVTYEKNYSHDNLGGWMSYMGNSSNSIARENLSVNDNGVIVKNMLSTNYSPSYFLNNVFVYDGAKLHQFHDETILSPVYFANNIFYNTSTTTSTTWSRKPAALTKAVFTNNAFYEAGGVASPLQPVDARAVTADPQFVGDPAAYAKNAGVAKIQDSAALFKLKATSPLIDKGRYNARIGTTDFFGTGRYYGTAPDIGLHETATGTQVTNPVDTDPIENTGVDTRVDLAKGKTAVASSTHPADNFTRLAASKLVDGDPSTRWAAADAPTYPVTVDIDFGSATTFDEVDLAEYTDPGTNVRVADFTLQRWDPATNAWVTFTTQRGVGAAKVVKDFGSITSTKLRLSIAGLLPGESYGPTLSEIRVFNSAAPVGKPVVTPTTATHDRNPAKADDPSNAVTFDVTLNGDTLQAIRYITTSGAFVGSLDTTDYVETVDGAVVHYRLTPAFYADKLLGTSGLQFDFTSGASQRVALEITDSSVGGTDTTAPVATVAATAGAAGANGWYTGDVTVTATATDDTDPAPAVEVSVDGGAWTPGPTAVVTGAGFHIVTARATDAAGNVSDPAYTVVGIDGTAPTTTATGAGTAGTPASPVTVTFAATDATSGVASTEYRLPGGEWTAAPAAGVVVGTVGTTTVEFRSTDVAGNVETAQSVVVTVTGVTAVVTSAGTPSEEGWYNTAAAVTLTGPANTTVQYRVNNGAWIRYSKPVSLTGNGQFAVDHRLLEGRTVVAGTQQTTTVRIDTKAPSTYWSANPSTRTGTPRNPVTIGFGAIDALSDVRSVEYRIGSGEWVASTAPVTFDSVGVSVFQLRSIDRAGNVSPVKSTTVTISADPALTVKAAAATVRQGAFTTFRLAGFHRFTVVTVSVGDAVIGSGTTDVGGALRVTGQVSAAPGSATVTATESGATPLSATTTIKVTR